MAFGNPKPAAPAAKPAAPAAKADDDAGDKTVMAFAEPPKSARAELSNSGDANQQTIMVNPGLYAGGGDGSNT